eukprot:6018598-Alexandrium_andersonii.AAC.1
MTEEAYSVRVLFTAPGTRAAGGRSQRWSFTARPVWRASSKVGAGAGSALTSWPVRRLTSRQTRQGEPRNCLLAKGPQ